jgi:hypothetical protein
MLNFHDRAKFTLVVNASDLDPKLESSSSRCSWYLAVECDSLTPVNNPIGFEFGHTRNFNCRKSFLEVNDFLIGVFKHYPKSEIKLFSVVFVKN